MNETSFVVDEAGKRSFDHDTVQSMLWPYLIDCCRWPEPIQPPKRLTSDTRKSDLATLPL